MVMQKVCQMWVRICVSLFFIYTKKAAGFLLRRGHLLKGGRVAY